MDKENEKLNIISVGCRINSIVTSGKINEGTTTNTMIWKGGWVTDNFNTYYLDENMIKHYNDEK